MIRFREVFGAASFAVLAAFPAASMAQSAPNDLAMQLTNPVANLISVPLQSNFEFDLGPEEDGFRYRLVAQPVVPFEITDQWNLISRTILPMIYTAGPGGDEFGLGDTVQSFFFSPKARTRRGVIWGVGPAMLFPTATDGALGQDQWGLGPTGVVLVQTGGWTYGTLVNHIESVDGDDDRPDTSATYLQPFLTYTRGTTTFGMNFEATYDWESEEWTAPMNLFVNKLANLGRQRISIGAGLGIYTDAPDSAPDWGVRFNFVLLYPR